MLDDAARMAEPGKDLADLGTVTLRGGLGGKKRRHHAILRCSPKQTHPPLCRPGPPGHVPGSNRANTRATWGRWNLLRLALLPPDGEACSAGSTDRVRGARRRLPARRVRGGTAMSAGLDRGLPARPASMRR